MNIYIQNQDLMMNVELITKSIKTFDKMSHSIEIGNELYFKEAYNDIFRKTIAKIVPDLKIQMDELSNNDSINYHKDRIDTSTTNRIEEIMKIFQTYDFLDINQIERNLRFLKNLDGDPDYYCQKIKSK